MSLLCLEDPKPSHLREASDEVLQNGTDAQAALRGVGDVDSQARQ